MRDFLKAFVSLLVTSEKTNAVSAPLKFELEKAFKFGN